MGNAQSLKSMGTPEFGRFPVRSQLTLLEHGCELATSTSIQSNRSAADPNNLNQLANEKLEERAFPCTSPILAVTGVDSSLSAPSSHALTDTRYSVPGSSARMTKSGSSEPPTRTESCRSGPKARHVIARPEGPGKSLQQTSPAL